jgi:hypothetical protein
MDAVGTEGTEGEETEGEETEGEETEGTEATEINTEKQRNGNETGERS